MRPAFVLPLVALIVGVGATACGPAEEENGAESGSALLGTPSDRQSNPPATGWSVAAMADAQRDYKNARVTDMSTLAPTEMGGSLAQARFDQSTDANMYVLEKAGEWAYVLVAVNEHTAKPNVYFYEYRRNHQNAGAEIGRCVAQMNKRLSNCVPSS